MEAALFAKGVLVNLLVILAVVALSGMARAWSVLKRGELRPWHTGLLFGVMAVVAMLFPVTTTGGGFFDCRSGVIGTAALLGGWVTALASIPLPMAYRFYNGGPAAVPGVLEIVLPALLGSLCHVAWRRGAQQLSPQRVVLMGVIISLGTNVPILFMIRAVMPEMDINFGVFGVALLILSTAITVSLLGNLILLEQTHAGAVQAVAESERRMRHSQKMAAIGRLSGRIAHSFMNALATILGNAQLAKERVRDRPDVAGLMDEITTTVGKISHLTSELLAFANPSPLRLREMDLSKCTAGIEELLRKSIDPDIELNIEAGERVGDVNMDPDQIEEAIVHLAVNASEAMSGRGRLTIKVEPARLTRAEAARLQAGTHERDKHRGAFALISVRDTGCGMDEDTKSHIFEPFFTTKKDQGNVGLGLSTVYSIVHMHHGYVDVVTRPHRGTTFLIYLPVVDTPPA